MDSNGQDFGKLLQQARMLQELMGADGGGRQPADGAGFVGSLDKAMQLVQTLQLFSGADAKVFFGDADPGEPELPTVDDSVDFAKLFDDEIATPSINAMKAALPFVDPSMHRSLGLWIKLMEMQRIFDLTSNGGALVPAAADYGDWRLGMLSAMRPYASPEKKSLIDFIGRMTGLMDTLGRQ